MTQINATPFESVDGLRAEHARLLRASRDPAAPAGADEIVGFLVRARATGAKLDFPADRELAQGALDYWTATLFTLPAGKAAATLLPAAIPGVTEDAVNLQLEAFDPATLRAATTAADAWLAGPGAKLQATARRVVLRLVRLQADGPRADTVPTVRSALQDLDDDPDAVNTVLAGLAAAGVVRVTKGDDDAMDRVALRAPELIDQWDTLSGWLTGRRDFRESVAAWARAGKPEALLAAGDALDDARRYHDRNLAERQYVIASAYHQARLLEKGKTDRRAKWVFAVAAVVFAGVALAATFLWRWSVNAAAQEIADAKVTAARDLAAAEADVRIKELTFEAAKERQKQIDNELSLRKKRQRLVNLTRVIRALAELGTAGADRDVARWRWDGLVATLEKDSEFLDQLETYGFKRADLKLPADDPAALRSARQALNAARRLKAEAATDPDTREALDDMRDATYETVVKAVQHAVDTYRDRSRSFADAIPAVREFWTLYWGEMGLFEGDQVIAGMRAVGDQLKAIEAHMNAQVLGKVDPKLLAPRNVTQTLMDLKSNPKRLADLKQFTEKLISTAVPGDVVAELQERLRKLEAAMAAERQQGAAPELNELPAAY